MDVFSGDEWRIFDWELGCETLPVDHFNRLWYDEHYWNDEGLFTCTRTTTMTPSLVDSKGESAMLTSTASAQSIVRPRSDAGTEVASKPILTNRECLPARLLEGQSGMSAETAKNQLRPTLASAVFPQSLAVPCLNANAKTRTFQKSSGQRPKKAKPNATSQYKGVTKHRVTGKFEAHLWDASVIRKGKNRRGRHRGKQIYLGSFNNELAAARTFDMAAICYWGDDTFTNFPVSDYSADMDLLKSTAKETVVKLLRRSEGGYSPGSDRFVGLAVFHTMQYEDQLSFDNASY